MEFLCTECGGKMLATITSERQFYVHADGKVEFVASCHDTGTRVYCENGHDAGFENFAAPDHGSQAYADRMERGMEMSESIGKLVTTWLDPR